MDIKIKRAYDPPDQNDGFRILVDRIWPRGLSKAKAKVDLWLKSIAPSSELRKWYNHDPEKWEQFKIKYSKELADNDVSVESLITEANKHHTVTLIFGSKELKLNNATALREFVYNKLQLL